MLKRSKSIRRIKGVKQLGCRAGNWLTQDQARLLLERAKGKGYATFVMSL